MGLKGFCHPKEFQKWRSTISKARRYNPRYAMEIYCALIALGASCSILVVASLDLSAAARVSPKVDPGFE